MLINFDVEDVGICVACRNARMVGIGLLVMSMSMARKRKSVGSVRENCGSRSGIEWVVTPRYCTIALSSSFQAPLKAKME